MNDDSDFKKAMRDVEPLHQDRHKRTTTKTKIPTKKRTAVQSQHIPYEYDFNLINQDDWVDGHDNVSFKHSGVQDKTLNKLKRGQYAIEARLDLHHFTAGEAMAMVDRFIEDCLIDGRRCVLLIHGKGTMSRENKPILKNILIEHLRKNLYVLAYHSAQPRDGGAGALYVLIKSSQKV